MKALVIQGSPHGKSGCTQKMLEPFLSGMKKAGADVDVIYLADKKIHHCIGCLQCWFKTPGRCVFQDDMADCLEQFAQADLIIFATPLYVFSMTGLMKNFLDRSVPLCDPFLIPHPIIPHCTTHPSRSGKKQKMFLISPCGFPEFHHFDSLIATFKQMAQMEGAEYLGEILRPSAEILKIQNTLLQWTLKGYFQQLEKAGQELIERGSISEKTQEALRKDLIPGGAETIRQRANEFFKKQLASLKTEENGNE